MSSATVAPPFVAPTTEAKTFVGCCWWDGLEVERQGATTTYQFSVKRFIFESCASCGSTFRVKSTETGETKFVNGRLLQDIDTTQIIRDPKYDWASKGVPRQCPSFKGPEFDKTELGPEERIYYGSCQCGDVTYGVKTKPLSEVNVKQCNCNACVRYGSVNFYPKPGSVHMSGAEHLGELSHPRGWKAFFCRRCDQLLFGGPVVPEAEPIANAKEVLGHDLELDFVNIRSLWKLEWEQLKIEHYDGRAKPPAYVIQ